MGELRRRLASKREAERAGSPTRPIQSPIRDRLAELPSPRTLDEVLRIFAFTELAAVEDGRIRSDEAVKRFKSVVDGISPDSSQ